MENLNLLNRITELELQIKNLQKDKIEIERRYRIFFELYRHAPVSFLMIDQTSLILEYNLAFSHLVDFNAKSLENKKLLDIIYPADKSNYLEYLTLYFKHNNQTKCQIRLLTESKAIVWVTIETIIVNFVDGKPIYFSVLEDITAQKIAEEKNVLVMNEKETVINSIHYLFWSLTKDFRLISCNENFKQSAKSFNGVEFQPGHFVLDANIYTKEMIQYWEGLYNRALKGEDVRSDYYVPADVGRQERWLEMQIIPIYYKGEITSLACFGRDVTSQKLHEIQLLQSSKMASLGEMAGGIAHEINNPLSILIGISSKMEKLLQQNEIQREPLLLSVSHLKETSNRISNVIKGLRAFSRNADKDPKQKVLLHSVISDTLGLCQEKFKANGVNLTVSHFGKLEFQGNATQISQVLLNLLNNSYDAIIGQTDKWININAEETLDNKIKIIITDSGKGIPPKIAEKIMQPFFTTKEVGKGTGLGLSISLGIMQSHGGTLYLANDSENTKFIMEVPKFLQS